MLATQEVEVEVTAEEEAVTPEEAKWVCMPCEEEVRKHELNHWPFRDWW